MTRATKLTMKDIAKAREELRSSSRDYVQVRSDGYFVLVQKTKAVAKKQIDKRVGGVRKSTTVTLCEIRSADDLIAAARMVRQPVEASQRSGHTLRTALDDYARSKKGLSPKTVASYQYALKSMPFSDVALERLQRDVIMQWHSQHKRLRTADLCVTTGRIVYKHAARLHGSTLDPRSPFGDFDLHNAREKTQAIEPRDLPAWFAMVDQLDPTRRAYHLCAILTGQRRSALAEATWGNIDFEAKRWTSIVKGNKLLVIPISSAVEKVLKDVYAVRGDDRWVFAASSRSGHIETVKEKRFPSMAVGHPLRATFISACEACEVPERLIKLLVGHELADVTEGYKALSYTWPRLVEASERVSEWLLTYRTA